MIVDVYLYLRNGTEVLLDTEDDQDASKFILECAAFLAGEHKRAVQIGRQTLESPYKWCVDLQEVVAVVTKPKEGK